MAATALLLAAPEAAIAASCDQVASDGSHFLPTSRRDIDVLYVRAGHRPIGCTLSVGDNGPHMACEDGTDSPYIQTNHAPPRGNEIAFDGKQFVTPCQIGPMSQEDIDAQRNAPPPEPLQSCRQYSIWRNAIADGGSRSPAAKNMCLQLNQSLANQGSPACLCN